MNYAIIAAGEGSRLAQEGVTLPKPLVRLHGEPMIGRLINTFLSCGAESISVIINESMPEVRTYLESIELPVPLRLTVKSTAGSMQSFHELSRTLDDGPFCLTTVDTVFSPEEFRRYIRAFEADTEADGYMAVTTYVDDEKPLYVAADTADNITGFLDNAVPGVRYISGGIYALRPQAVEILADCMEAGVTRMRDYQRALVASGQRLKAYPFGKIIDVDHAADIAAAEKEFPPSITT